MEDKKFYSLQFVKELREVQTIEDVNKYLKENWLLLQVTTNENSFIFLIGRVN